MTNYDTMSSIDTARQDVAKLQSTLASVQTGLDTLETATETVREARRGLRRVLKVGLILALVGVVAYVVMSKRSKSDTGET